MSRNPSAQAARVPGLLRRPCLAEFDAGNGLRTYGEASGDVNLPLASRYGFADEAVPLIESLRQRPPFLALLEHGIGRQSLDDQVRVDDPHERLAVLGVLDHEHVALAPVRLLVLRADDTEAESCLHGFENSAITVGQDDADTSLGRGRHPTFAIRKACQVPRKCDIAPLFHTHSLAVVGTAVAVPVAEWIARRVVAAERPAEVEGAA